ncbi:MAG: hypothetical protein DF168_01120 [Candidatus Moanabacter tarae]|uniref:CBS domain-containing protein n=1 Tax=Candidatus Moanibacter tarae TaxID=2200854 RepID=A0A2Z4AQ30_9BACT|nr:MAG: hypothetical protein DF168_01120 [Candidatus Moanabacter tarae]
MNLILYGFVFEIIGAVALLMLNALLVTFEFSVIKIRLSHFEDDAHERINQWKGPSRLLENAEKSVRVARLGTLLCTFGYAAAAFLLLEPFFASLNIYGYSISPALSGLISVILAVSLHYIVGDLVPRSLALTFPEHALRSSSWAIRVIGVITRPFFGPLHFLAGIVLKPFGAKPESDLDTLALEGQLRTLEESPEEFPVLPKILKNVIKMKDTKVQDILFPRNQVQFLDVEEDNEANLELMARSGHTRFPLCEGDLDNCIGLVHIKDVFHSTVDVSRIDLRRIKREMTQVDPQDPVEDVLQKLLLSKTHMALVRDDFGGTVGVVTMEQVIEELVGEIQDEFDAEETLIDQISHKEYRVSGLAPLRDVEDTFGVELENKDEVTTFGGLITVELGRIPKTSESLVLNDLEVRITEVDETRVISTTVKNLL